jgi:hypothetical protein
MVNTIYTNYLQNNTVQEFPAIVQNTQVYNDQKPIERIYIWIYMNLYTNNDFIKLQRTIESSKKYAYMTCVSYYTKLQEDLVPNLLQSNTTGDGKCSKFLLTKSKTMLAFEQHIDKLWECFSIHSTIRSLRQWDVVMICNAGDLVLNNINELIGNRSFVSQKGCCYTNKDYQKMMPETIVQMIKDFDTNINTKYDFCGQNVSSGTTIRIYSLLDYYKQHNRYNVILFDKHLYKDDIMQPNIFHYN